MFLFPSLRPPIRRTSVGKIHMDNKDLNNKIWWQEALAISYRLIGWILLPLVIGFLLGKWLDRRYNSSPRWFFIVIGVSFIISMIGLVIQAKREYKNISKK